VVDDDGRGLALLGRFYLTDDLTGPSGLEQSTAPGSPFDVSGHLGGVTILACGAVKSEAVGQSHWRNSLSTDQGGSFMDDGRDTACTALKYTAVDQSHALLAVVVYNNGRHIVCTALVDMPAGQSLWRDTWSTVMVDNDGRDMALLDRQPAVDRPDKAWTIWLYLVDLTGPYCLEQFTIPEILLDAPGHLRGIAILACSALKGAAVGGGYMMPRCAGGLA
jgi:hypothetical protein